MNKIKKSIKYITSNILLIAYLAIIIQIAFSTKYIIGYSKNTILPYLLIGILAFIILDRNIAKKRVLAITKTDCFVILLGVSSVIPLILGKVASLESAIMEVIKYIAIIQIYFITKYIISINISNRKILINLFIIIAVILALLGIEKMTSNRLNLLSFDKTRLESLFNSGNTLAAIIGVAIFLSIGQLKESKRKATKIFQIINISILVITFILTYSRLMYMAFIVTFILYIILNKKTNFNKKLFILILISVIVGIVYASIFNKIILSGEYYKIWIGLIIAVLINTGFNYFFILKLEKIISSKSKKYILMFLTIIIIVLLMYIAFLRKISKPLTLFNSKTAETKYEKVIQNIQENTNYTMELDIEAESNVGEIFEIIIEERNKYQDYEEAQSIKLGNYKGKKILEFTTQANTSELHIIFKTSNTSENTKLIINNVIVNGKEEILNYKYLPTKLIEKIKGINFQNKSVWERLSFYSDAGKLIKENWLTGIGGGCWKYRYTEQQSYKYISTEVHSYPIQLFLEFGILGIIAYLGIIISIIKKMLEFSKKNEESKLEITCALVCILLHSCFDYDMSFMYVITMVFSLIASIDNHEGKKLNTQNSKLINYILIILISVIVLSNTINFIYLINIDKITKLNRKKQESIYNNLLILMPYNKTIRIQNTRISDNYLEEYKYLLDKEPYYLTEDETLYIYVMHEFVNQAIKENKLDNLETLFSYFEKTKLTNKFYPRYQINRLSAILTLGEYINKFEDSNNQVKLKELEQKAYNFVINEIDQKKQSILDYNNGRYPEANIEFYEKDLQLIYEKALEMLK